MKTEHNEILLQEIIDIIDPHDRLREDELTKRIARKYAEKYALQFKEQPISMKKEKIIEILKKRVQNLIVSDLISPLYWDDFADTILSAINEQIEAELATLKDEGKKGIDAEDWLKENCLSNDWNRLEENLNDSLWTNNVLKYMKNFAQQSQPMSSVINEEYCTCNNPSKIGDCYFADDEKLIYICSDCGKLAQHGAESSSAPN